MIRTVAEWIAIVVVVGAAWIVGAVLAVAYLATVILHQIGIVDWRPDTSTPTLDAPGVPRSGGGTDAPRE